MILRPVSLSPLLSRFSSPPSASLFLSYSSNNFNVRTPDISKPEVGPSRLEFEHIWNKSHENKPPPRCHLVPKYRPSACSGITACYLPSLMLGLLPLPPHCDDKEAASLELGKSTNKQQQPKLTSVLYPCGESDKIHTKEVQLDCRSARRTRKINLPTNQRGYDNSETTVGKLLARRIFRSTWYIFVKIIFDLLFFRTCEKRIPTKIYQAESHSPRWILWFQGLGPFWGASDQWKNVFLVS